MNLARHALAGAVALAAAALGTATDTRAANAPDDARAALNQPIHELNVEDRSLEKVIDYLRNVTGANLVVNWRALEASGVTRETPVSLNIREVTMRKVLQLVLDQASPLTPLNFNVDSNVITVSSQAELDRQLITRIYPVDDLVMVPNNVQPPMINLNQLTSSGTTSVGGNNGGGGGFGSGGFGGGGGGGGAGSGGQGFFTQNNANSAPTETSDQKGQAIVDLIKNIIRPEIWADNGGTATIRYYSGKLIITAPQSVHEAIGGAGGGKDIRIGM